jgi:hypothetical protein
MDLHIVKKELPIMEKVTSKKAYTDSTTECFTLKTNTTTFFQKAVLPRAHTAEQVKRYA